MFYILGGHGKKKELHSGRADKSRPAAATSSSPSRARPANGISSQQACEGIRQRETWQMLGQVSRKSFLRAASHHQNPCYPRHQSRPCPRLPSHRLPHPETDTMYNLLIRSFKLHIWNVMAHEEYEDAMLTSRSSSSSSPPLAASCWQEKAIHNQRRANLQQKSTDLVVHKDEFSQTVDMQDTKKHNGRLNSIVLSVKLTCTCHWL